jgi:glycosyltransferase involved in cell wall biosynthesis
VRRRQAVVLAGYGAADLRIAPSRFLRARYLDTGAFDPRDFVYSPNGLRSGDGGCSAAGPGGVRAPVRFGFVGALVWYKGVEVLLEAFARLPTGSAALAIHGAFDPQHDAHHRRLEELAGPGVRFHGRFDNARLREVFEGIDALVVPSVWYENAPITIQEAFLCRTPVLAGDEGGMAELLEGGGGLTFRTGDAGDLARVMGALAREPERLVAIAAAGFPAVKSIAENARELEFRYRALACRRPRERPDRAAAAARGKRPAGGSRSGGSW